MCTYDIVYGQGGKKQAQVNEKDALLLPPPVPMSAIELRKSLKQVHTALYDALDLRSSNVAFAFSSHSGHLQKASVKSVPCCVCV